MTMPIKVYIPPMSFTLASHVAIFLAMFISPGTAAIVALGTTVGFVFSGLPIDVWFRALSHVIWAYGGALWLQKHPDTLSKPVKSAVFWAR
jgi:niacin transporter